MPKKKLQAAIARNGGAVANVVTLGSTQKKNADCDADSEISGNDAVVLLKFLVSIIHTLPSAE